ncbi:MAG: molybdopterin converting factor subunit 1 [bacterium]
MKITLLFFASLRDRLKTNRLELDLPGGTVQDALDHLGSRHPEVRDLLARIHTAVNEEYREKDAPLREGDVLALIPPVSGGGR